MNIIGKFGTGLSKTRNKIAQLFQTVFREGLTDYYDHLEEFLVLTDVGPEVACDIVAEIKGENSATPIADLKRKLIVRLGIVNIDKPVKIFVGINGSGKTTTIGKLSHYLTLEGKSVFVIGTDTFRAAANMQLEEWCQRTQVPFLVGKPGSDPASVMFDGLNSNLARNADCILCDTAGRLHSSKNLMQELDKIFRVANKLRPNQVEVLLVLDAAIGQNALVQMETFTKWVKPEGIVLSKLDGSAKGGIAIPLVAKYGVPIKYVGVGEQLDDLLPFSPDDYVESLFAGIEDRHS